MAIKINSTVVIDDNRVFKNITGMNGIYSDFHPLVSKSLNTTLDFSIPFQDRVLNSNTTYSSNSNKGPGFSKMLIIDTNDFTLAFSSMVKWAGNVTPDFSLHRFWTIGLICWTNNTILGSASGMAVADPVISELSDPLTFSQFIASIGFDDSDGQDFADTSVSFGLLNNGTVRARTEVGGDDPQDTITSWFDNPGGINPAEYEVIATRLTNDGSTVSGTFGTQLNLATNRFWNISSTSGETNQVEISFQIREVANVNNTVSRSTTLIADSNDN